MTLMTLPDVVRQTTHSGGEVDGLAQDAQVSKIVQLINRICGGPNIGYVLNVVTGQTLEVEFPDATMADRAARRLGPEWRPFPLNTTLQPLRK